jgi:hypothetical protein
MPKVDLTDSQFAELASLARPFVDTDPAKLVARLIHEEVLRRKGAKPSSDSRESVMVVNPIAHESLLHARLLAATVDGEDLFDPNWNNLLAYLHVLAMKRLGSFAALERVSLARLRFGKHESSGFKFLPEANISIQGLEANRAWDGSLVLAREIQVAIKAQFEWYDKSEAAHPGKRGMMEFSPPRLARIRSPRLVDPAHVRLLQKHVTELPNAKV